MTQVEVFGVTFAAFVLFVFAVFLWIDRYQEDGA